MPVDLPELVQNIPYLTLFVAFSVGLTQIIKDEYDPKNVILRLIAALSLVGSALLFNYIPVDLQPYYLLLLVSVAVPGVVGLYKEGKGEKTVVVTDQANDA